MDRLIGLSEAADIMNASYSKIQKMAKAGKLPCKKVEGRWGVSRNALYRQLGLDVPDEEVKIA